jgi:hypothetical protein
MTEMEFSPNMAVFTPEGREPSQVKAEHPATTYDMFKREILNEIARCLNMPYNIAACDSSGYNYASGRLDHQAFFKAICPAALRLPEVSLMVFREVIQHRAFRDVFHNGDHLFNRPFLGPKVEAPTVELAGFFVVKVGGVQLAEHRHRRYSVKNR